MRAKLPPRVLGPYQDRDKWRLIITTIRAAEQGRHRASASTLRRLLKSPAMANLPAQATSSGLEINIGVEQMPTDSSGFNRGGEAPGQGGDKP